MRYIQLDIFLNSALDEAKRPPSLPGRFTVCQTATGIQDDWTPETVWKLLKREKSLTSTGNRTQIYRTTRKYPSHYTH